MVFRYGIYLGLFISINLVIELTISSEKSHYLTPLFNLFTMLIIATSFLFDITPHQVGNKVFLKKGLSIGLIGSGFAAMIFFVYTMTFGKTYYDDLLIREISKLKAAGYDEYDIQKAIVLGNLLKMIHVKEISIFLSSVLKFFAIILIMSGLNGLTVIRTISSKFLTTQPQSSQPGRSHPRN